MKTATDAARMREILASYGSNPAHWPETERDALLAYLRGASDGAIALEAAGVLDDMLALSIVPQPSIMLEEWVLRTAPRPRPSRRLRLWWTAALLAGAAGGVAAGSAAAFAPIELPGYGRADATAFGAVFDPQEEKSAKEDAE